MHALIVYGDDATSRLLAAGFSAETTVAYMSHEHDAAALRRVAHDVRERRHERQRHHVLGTCGAHGDAAPVSVPDRQPVAVAYPQPGVVGFRGQHLECALPETSCPRAGATGLAG